MRLDRSFARVLVAALLVLGVAGEVRAALPGGLLLQRRGYRIQIPAKPAVIDSSPTIETLNKALKALGSTDLPYDGHREKAVAHVAAAIHHLETPTTHGRSNAAIEKAASGNHPSATKTATTPQAASDEALHKAKTILFNAHHQLADHTASRGHLRADANVRIAIDEIVHALNPPATATGTATATAATHNK